MNIKRAKEEIKNTIRVYLSRNAHGEYEIPAMRQRPVLLIGPPGIGKTQIMEQIARECQIGLVSYTITHHTRQSAIGLPFITEKTYGGQTMHVTEYTMSEIVASVYEQMEETGLSEGILFIDEINCVSETLAPAMLQFLQYKTFGNHRIPEGWVIVAAGNPPEYNKSVREFDIATLDRVKRMDVEADFEVWKEYAVQAGIHASILSYLTARPQYFCHVETTVDGKIFVTPRGWEDLSEFLTVYESAGLACDREVVYQYIRHAKIARDFAGYLELYRKYQAEYQIEEALAGKRDETLMESASRAPFDERISVVNLILARLGTEFCKAADREDYLSLLLEHLKAFRNTLGEDTAAGAYQALKRQAETLWQELEQKKKAMLLTRKEQYRYRDTAETLERWLNVLGKDSLADEAVARIRARFSEETKAHEELCGHIRQMLEYAFDFIEGAFGGGQEMVMFITELNTNVYAMRFLNANECKRYDQYNRQLLFEDREAGLTKRLDRLGVF